VFISINGERIDEVEMKLNQQGEAAFVRTQRRGTEVCSLPDLIDDNLFIYQLL
jgi:hypothetical protein